MYVYVFIYIYIYIYLWWVCGETMPRPEVPLVSLFIVENIPMLHARANSAARTLEAERPQALIPTPLALYTLAPLLTAMAVFICGDVP